ncbi:lipopolysaccharide transport periplasmic protein LptA [Hydrogenophaga sp. OTU3427]|uniref:lipopolysaccharide transport periplasmic protein LptA n=1 Tax=Hydrogenophaga sp. OTU3427 TaxID=3043856 RepID=UPI00313BBB87
MPYTPMTRTTFTRTCQAGLLAMGLLSGAAALAAKADRNQPMNVEADSLRHEDGRQTSVFTGNVVVNKGSIVIRGQQIEVRQGPQGQQFGTVLGNTSTQAFFRQKRDVVDEYIEGVADRIEYDSQADTVRFIGRAVLRRYRGASLNDETAGNTIVYDNNADVFTVDGGAAARTPANPSGRVRAMLTPVPKGDTSGPAPVTAPAPDLKATPALGEGKR